MSSSNGNPNSKPYYLQKEEAVSEEFKSSVSSLPHKKMHFGSSIYQYQGFWYPLSVLPGVINFQQNFHPQSSDIFTIAFPKSGTTWLKSLLFTLSNRRQFPVNDANHPILTANPFVLYAPFGAVSARRCRARTSYRHCLWLSSSCTVKVAKFRADSIFPQAFITAGEIPCRL
ncbi:cytosolic sulfotransferase 6-like [Andrographis paniculata]|uniref:cytosolic sulfotransferase 6-like n=1 Tax=Andrographis paniculata TaxID=175694 RepID=UPI0021E72AE3|nr:cytosolic sulfotransferase 6-like [Andrographis paniculata]